MLILLPILLIFTNYGIVFKSFSHLLGEDIHFSGLQYMDCTFEHYLRSTASFEFPFPTFILNTNKQIINEIILQPMCRI